MTWQMAFVFVLLIAAIIAFVREKIAPELVALSLFVLVALTGLVPVRDAFAVFSNPAPITVAAMFVLSAALVRCGALDYLTMRIERASTLPYWVVIFLLVGLVAFVSAWINNTPVVVVLVPVVLNLAKRMKLAPSKFLIPLSYASNVASPGYRCSRSPGWACRSRLSERSIFHSSAIGCCPRAKC